MKSEYSTSALDHLRRSAATRADDLTRLRHELAVSDYKRLTLEMDVAVLRGDVTTWAAAMSERNRLDVNQVTCIEIADYVSPLRCRCCLRLVGVSGTCKEAA